MKQMKHIVIYAVLAMALCLSLTACGGKTEKADLWANATYTEDAEIGTGAKTVEVQVVAEDKSVTLTVHTDQKTLESALTEHGLISGEQGAYGLYVKVVNGITADYDMDQSYWGLNKNGSSLQTGVSGAEISGGEHFELVYTK